MSFRTVQQNTIKPKSFIKPATPNAIPSQTSTSWTRNPAWLPLPSVSSSEQKIVMLMTIWDNDSNFLAFTCQGAYTVDWGDGSSVENIASNVKAQHQYTYSNPQLYDTDRPVTFTVTTNIVNRSNHGYTNGQLVNFYNITSTTGINEQAQYYVINATTNTFQISLTSGGSAVAFGGSDGGANLVPFKQAVVTITPQAGNNLTSAVVSTYSTYTSKSTTVNLLV